MDTVFTVENAEVVGDCLRDPNRLLVAHSRRRLAAYSVRSGRLPSVQTQE